MSHHDDFATRVARLPHLGLGLSTEFGARTNGVDLARLRRERPDLVRFLEIGADLERGVDVDAVEWARAGLPVTYHFLDLNLEEEEDLDAAWIEGTTELARELGAAWLCGDAGLWHVGPRERGHGTLMPPVLVRESARAMARNVRALRDASGFEVLPENPPAHVYVGDLHLLDYYALVAGEADSGLLLDVAHLAVYQRVTGRDPLDGLDGFPLERVVEAHVAGGRVFEHGGKSFVDDDHGLDVLPETWRILDAVLERTPNLRALVMECERNPFAAVVGAFEQLRARVAGSTLATGTTARSDATTRRSDRFGTGSTPLSARETPSSSPTEPSSGASPGPSRAPADAQREPRRP